MKLTTRVQTGAFRDGLWRDANGLAVHLRVASDSPQVDDYLVKFLSGSLRVAPGLMTISRGRARNYRSVTINVSDADLNPILQTLPPVPQARLFEE